MLLLCISAYAQKTLLNNIMYRELSTSDILPTTNIAMIMQDRNGYLWYATNGEGLCKDDGYNIKVYNSHGYGKDVMQSDEVSCLCEDKKGNIIFGTRKGLYKLNVKDNKISRIEHNLFNRKKVNCLACDDKGQIWAGAAQSLIRFDQNGKFVKEYYIGDNRRQEVKEIIIDSKGTLWLTILRGGIATLDNKTDTITQRPWNLPVAASYMVENTRDGFFWVGTWGMGIVRYKADGTIILQDTPTSLSQFGLEVNNMIIDTTHNVMWVSTMDNLYAYSTDNNRLTLLSTNGFLPQEKKLIGKITRDRYGNIWVPGMSSKTFCLTWNSGGIRRDDVHVMTERNEYKLMADKIIREGDYFWIYQRRTRLSLYNMRSGEITFMNTNAKPVPLATQKAITKYMDGDGVWSCDGKHLIHIWHKGMDIYWEEDTLGKTPNYISALNDLGNGKLLIGTEKQVLRYDYRSHKIETLKDSTGTIHSIAWGTKGLEYSTTPTDLPSLVDKHGHLWTLTEKTLTETNPKTGAFRVIKAEDRNINVDCFTDMTLAGDSICVGGTGAFFVIAPCMELDKKNKHVSITLADSTHLTTLNHAHSKEIQFAYRFVRQSLFKSLYDAEWIYLDKGVNEISYDGVNDGDYILEARCTDEYGNWSDIQSITTFSIPSPLYRRWYSICIYLILTSSTVFFLIKKRRKDTQDTTPADTVDNPTIPSNSDKHITRLDKEAIQFKKQVTALIKQNLDNADYDSVQLANDMNLSRSNLYRKFQRYSNVCSPSEYIRNMRLEEGQRQLRETSLSITEISYNVGFSSSQYFAKCFKDLYGMTPKEYRSSHD